MERPNENGSIRLTNKTAIALRKSARQERTLALSAAIILTALLAALAVILGIRWLVAVPLLTALAVMMDAAIAVRARSRYQMLNGQAICAEAAARQMRVDRRERDRRAQAQRDLEDVKADVMSAALQTQIEMEEKTEVEEKAEEDVAENDDRKPSDLPQVPPVRRRRRQASLTILRSEDVK